MKKNFLTKLKNFLSFVTNKFWIISISCLQLGDTGKGKFIDVLALLADIIARCGGGPNAGHSVVINGKERVFHNTPSGMAHDEAGKINIIATGALVDPKITIEEIKILQSGGIRCRNLKISLKANVIMPYHIVLDRLGESQAGEAKIGTTGKGITPTYTDDIGRRHIIMNDLLNPEIFRKQLAKSVVYAQKILASANRQAVKEIMQHESLESGAYYQEDGFFNLEAIAEKYLAYGEFLGQFVEDTDTFLQESVGKKRILLEGAQGYLLGIRYGGYPFVTSSDSSPAGLLDGAGLENEKADVAFGIIKGFYMTRVGRGPFPTELGGRESDVWCNGGVANRQLELEKYPNADINDPNPMIQGIAIRRKGNEYGATTTRPRRVGWLDLPLFKYSLRSGVRDIIMTKLDILTGVETIKICYGYQYVPPQLYPVYKYGKTLLPSGLILDKAIVDSEVLPYCVPLYKEFPGWTEDISQARNLRDLPKNLIEILKFIFWVHLPDCTLRIISVGPDREETIFLEDGEFDNI